MLSKQIENRLSPVQKLALRGIELRETSLYLNSEQVPILKTQSGCDGFGCGPVGFFPACTGTTDLNLPLGSNSVQRGPPASSNGDTSSSQPALARPLGASRQHQSWAPASIWHPGSPKFSPPNCLLKFVRLVTGMARLKPQTSGKLYTATGHVSLGPRVLQVCRAQFKSTAAKTFGARRLLRASTHPS